VTTVSYAAVDNAGNLEGARTLTVRLDETAPEIVAVSRSPAANANGWNNGDVTVRFAARDGLSGIDGAAAFEVVVGGEGRGLSASHVFVDRAGNKTTGTATGIAIDRTPPTVACSATPPSLWPPNGKLVPIRMSVQVADRLSGPSGFALRSTASSEPGAAADLQDWTLGTPDVEGKARARRLGGGRGRTYTFGYDGRDVAGNRTRCETHVVVPHDAGKGKRG
jgi:hypothetical protein